MENEQMRQPTYEELAQAYTNIAKKLEETTSELQAIRNDKILERLESMTYIIEHSDKFPKSIVNLAVWHAKQIMARPKK